LHYHSGATADWWSVGIILFELIVGIPPFNAEHPQVRTNHCFVSELKFILGLVFKCHVFFFFLVLASQLL